VIKLGVIGLAAMMIATPVASQIVVPCYDRAGFVDYLKQKYQERRTMAGINHAGWFVEFFANGRSGTWTIIKTSPRGCSRTIESGFAFMLDSPKPFKPRI